MKYELSSIFIMLAFLFGIASFSTTTYGGNKKQTNTWSVTVQKPEEDWKEDSKEPIRQIENLPKIIWNKTKTNAEVISKTANPVKSSSIRTPTEIYDQVKHLWYREDPTIALISTCKGASLRPDHCILVWLTLMYNEAWNQQNSKACVDRNNCFGIQSWKKSYSSLDEGMENWVQKYNKYWYKADSAWFFYSKAWKVSPSRYCTSEDSSGSSMWCPHGLSIASDKWSKLYKIIY